MVIAWWFPLGHGFFSLAIVMSVVAMATHQIKSGFLLLASAFAGMLVCWLVFLAAFAALITGTTQQIAGAGLGRRLSPPATPVLRSPGVRLTHPANTFSPAIIRPDPTLYIAPSNLTGSPLHWNELVQMLRTGYPDDKIIAAASQRPLVGPLGSMQAEILRTEGASDKLVNYLQARCPDVSPVPATPARQFVAAVPAVAIPQPGVFSSVPPVAPIDYAVRAQRIADLTKQINSLDDAVRHYRTMPTSSRNQQVFDGYLKSLDQQRDELRRQKWQLEGR